jgi:cytochrome P450 family 142 subfamily A polypeptide 1
VSDACPGQRVDPAVRYRNGVGLPFPAMTATTSQALPDLLAPAFWADLDSMHAFFTEARAAGPVWRDDANGLWAVVRHAEVLEVERASGVFRSRPGYRSFENTDEADMIAKDDPEHLAQRRIVSAKFAPRSVQAMAPMLGDLIDELVNGAVALAERDGDVEIVDALAAQLPSRLTARLLGFPEERWRDIKSWSERLMRIDMAPNDMDVAMGLVSAIQEFAGVIGETATARRGCPADDLISSWVGADFDAITMVHETGLFISGGAETTRTVIARGLRVLADHPDQWEAAAADPSLIPDLVEELLRWVTPLNNFFRTAEVDTQIGGQPVAAGDRICIVYPSANRDELVFDDPFRFDIRRNPNPQVAFGHGTHFCLGVNLARTELRMLFGALTQRITKLRVVSEPDIEDNIFAGAVRSFRLAFEVR